MVELWNGRSDVQAGEFLDALAGHRQFANWELSIEEVAAEVGNDTLTYRDAVAAPYRAYAKKHGKERWGDKTPRYIEHIPFLAELFPEGRFVHVIRDGRDVALSYADVPFGPKTVARAAALWAERVRSGMRAGRRLGTERYRELRYERFVEQPEAELAELCEFLDVEFDPTMLEPDRARRFLLERAAVYNPHVSERPTPGMRDWEKDLPAPQIEVFEAIAGDVLSELGYEVRSSHPRALTRLRASAGRAGLPVDRLPRRTRS